MRISYLTMALALASPTMLFAQSAAEITEQSVVEVAAVAAAPAVQISQSIERGDSSERGNWGDRDGGNVERSSAPQSRIERSEPAVAQSAPDVQIAGRGERGERDFGGNRERGGVGGDWRGRGGNADSGSAPQQPQSDFRSQQPRFEPPVQPAAPQFERNRFGGRGNDGSTVNTSPPQAPQAQAQNDSGFRRDRGGRFGNRDGNREGGFGDRSGNGPQIDTRPQQRPEGQVFDQNRDQNRGQDHAQNHDGRFGQGGRPDVNRDNRGDNRNGVFTRGWQRGGDRFDGNHDGRFDRNRNDRSGHRFERHNGGWVDRSNRNRFGNDYGNSRNRFGNDYGNNRNRFGNDNRWNREWREDRRYNWQGYRNLYRDNYRQPRYYNPYGYGYGYQRHGIGIYLNSLFFSSRYWINDPYEYRLPAAPYGYRWIRYYDDVLLVEQRSGYVVDVIYSFFW